jgi:transcriptional regulator with XRE-family HTH domain
MGFGAQLHSVREAARMSQQELADRAGISIDSIQNWEQDRNHPRMTFLPVLAAALGVSLDVLVMGGTHKPQTRRPRGRPKKDAGPADEKPAAKKTEKRKEK